MPRLINIILAGGRGERLWPQSDVDSPKQFNSVTGGKKTILEETLDRTSLYASPKDIYISTMKDIYPLLKKTLPQFPKKNVILEPMIRDTACALLLAVLSVPASDEDVFIFIPADHFVNRLPTYKKNILQAFDLTKKNKRATLIGIPPNSPATQYGYLKVKHISKSSYHYMVESFVEKPNLSKAKRYYKGGNYFWNSGIFMFNRKFLLDQFTTHVPELFQQVTKYLELNKNPKNQKKALQVFSQIKKISFDFAIAEKLTKLDCVKADFFWDDIGNWESFFRVQKPNKDGNILNAKDCFVKDSKDNLCIVEDGKSVVLNGVNNLIVIYKKNKIYVAHRNSADKIKAILKEIH